jgi:hypothetical protein
VTGSLFNLAGFGHGGEDENLVRLRRKSFDVRKRFYESESSYRSRLAMIAYVFEIEYPETKWASIESVAELCPGGSANRLPRDKREMMPHDCWFLRIKDVRPEYWCVPADLSSSQARDLPIRATYKPVTGDILLSRFKEPLGKCVIYRGHPYPLYASSNYLLLRPRPGVPPTFILAVLKSCFGACQLHRLIHQGTVITEMFQRDARRILVPLVAPAARQEIANLCARRIAAEESYKSCLTRSISPWAAANETHTPLSDLYEPEADIDSILRTFQEAAS